MEISLSIKSFYFYFYWCSSSIFHSGHDFRLQNLVYSADMFLIMVVYSLKVNLVFRERLNEVKILNYFIIYLTIFFVKSIAIVNILTFNFVKHSIL